jgi:hypothetical protein
MRKLGLSRLLQAVVILPLMALAGFGGVLVFDTLTVYRQIERMATSQQFVTFASSMTTRVLSEETMATNSFAASGSEDRRAIMIAARQRSDEAIRSYKQAAAAATRSLPHANGPRPLRNRKADGADSPGPVERHPVDSKAEDFVARDNGPSRNSSVVPAE